MLGMFTLLMCVVIGKVVYEICLHLLNRFRGNKATNTTIEVDGKRINKFERILIKKK